MWSLLRRFLYILVMFLEMSFLSAESNPQKTLLVLSCRGGGGHTAAAQTLQQLLGEEYKINIIHPIDELHIWGVRCGTQVYNSMLQRGWTRTMNFVVRHLVPRLFKSREDKLEKMIGSSIHALQPDLIISLIPFINYPASEAARKHQIPYLLITTDHDLRHWVLRMENLKHPDFKVTIGSDLATSKQLLLSKNIPESAIEMIGLPLRPEFVVQRDEKQIRDEFQIPEDKPVALIMMGAAGSSKVYDYAKKIGQLDLGLHLIIVMGRDEKIAKDLRKIPFHPSNSITLLGFTDRVADLMAISDLMITKPGTITITEALAMQVPIFVDNTANLLFWERINVDMVLNYGVGQRITHRRQIQEFLENYLADAEIRDHLNGSYVSVPPNNFHLKIKGIIDDMVTLRARHCNALLTDSHAERSAL